VCLGDGDLPRQVVVRDLDDRDAALGEQLQQPHRRDPRVDDGEIAVER